MMNEANMNHEAPQLYMNEYYNMLPFIRTGESNCIARIINSLIDALNERRRLPRFLLVILDHDIIDDADPFKVDLQFMQRVINWLLKQIDLLIKRRRLEITEKRPGTIFTSDPKVIFAKMIRRVEYYPPKSRLEKVCMMRGKFNEVLNDAAAKRNHHIMNIMRCTSTDHFVESANLSLHGKVDFWFEVDELLKKFDRNQIKLLPAKRGKRNFHNN